MAEVLQSSQDLLQNWMQSGAVHAMYDSYKDYAQSPEFNDYRGTSLLESARRNKETLGLSDEEIDKNPILAQVFASVVKLAEYGGRGVDKAIESGDPNAIRNIKARQAKMLNAVNDLSNHKANRDNFINTFAGLTSMAGGRSNTFGEQTSLDEGIVHDVGIGTEFWHGFTDAMGSANILEAFKSNADKEKIATEKEILRTGQIPTGIVGTAANLVGTVGGFMLESMLLAKGAGKITKNAAKAQTVSDWSRWIGQGAVLPILQNVNEQTGLTEKYLGDHEIEANFFKALADGAHNMVGMIAGDKLLSPLINKNFLNSTLKKQTKVKAALLEFEDTVAGGSMSFNDALAATQSKMIKMPGIKKDANRILAEIKRKGNKIDNTSIARALEESWRITNTKDLITAKSLRFGVIDLASDYTFDLLSHNVAAGLGKMTGDYNVFSVAQNRQFGFDELSKQGIGQGILSSLTQRAGMRFASKTLNRVKLNKTAEKMDLKDTFRIAGSEQWYKDLGIKMDNPVMKGMAWMNGFYGEDFLRQVDMDLQEKTGRSITDLATSGDIRDDLFNAASSWYARNFAGNKALLSITSRIDDTFDTKTANELWKMQRLGGLEGPLRDHLITVLKSGNIKLNNKNDEKAQNLADYITKSFPKTEMELKEKFDLRDIKVGKDIEADIKRATSADAKTDPEKGNIDDIVMSRFLSVMSNIGSEGDPNNKFLQNVLTRIKSNVQKDVKEIIGEDFTGIQLSTIKAIEGYVKNIDSFKTKLKENDLEEARLHIEREFHSDISEGSLPKEQKQIQIETAKGVLTAFNKEFGATLEGIANAKIDRSAMTGLLAGISKKVMDNDISNVDTAAAIYDELDRTVSNAAREQFKEYRTNIETAVANRGKITDDGLQRRVFANTYMAWTLARDVGFRWENDVREFAEQLTSKNISEILNDAAKNDAIFSRGSFSEIKAEWTQADNFANKMMSELYDRLSSLKRAKVSVFEQITGQLRTDDQLRLIEGEGTIDQTMTSSARSAKPIFYWNDEVDRANISTEGIVQGLEIRLESEAVINDNYGRMITNPNSLDKLDLTESDMIQMISAAAIKNFDVQFADSTAPNKTLGSSKNYAYGRYSTNIGPATVGVEFSDGEYRVDLKLNGIRHNVQSDLVDVKDFADMAFSTTRDIRKFRQVHDNRKNIFELNGSLLDIDQFVKDLNFKAPINGFSFEQTATEYLARNTDRDTAKDKILKLVEYLEPGYIADDDNRQNVNAMVDQWISKKSGEYGFEYKMDMLIKNVDGVLKYEAKNLQANATATNTVTEFANGRIRIMDINFDEKIDYTKPETLNSLRKMNIIPLSRNFRNDLSPVWVQVQDLPDLNTSNSRATAKLKETVKSVLTRRWDNSLNKRLRTEDQLRLEDPQTFEEAALKAVYQAGDSMSEKAFMEHVMNSVIKYEEESLNKFINKTKTERGTEELTVAKTDAIKGSLDRMNVVLDIIKNKTVLDPLKDKILTSQKELKELQDKISKTIDDTSYKAIIEQQYKLTAELAQMNRDMAEAFDDKTLERNVSRALEGGYQPAYSTDKDNYKILSAVNDAVSDTASAIKNFKELIKGAKEDDLRGHFYTLMAFNEAALAAKTLEKRISYMYTQDNLMKGGQIVPDVKRALDKFLTKGGKVYLTYNEADGMNYMPSELYDIMQNTVGLTGGKYTSNSSFGGKFMMRKNWMVRKDGQEIKVVGERASRPIGENDVLLDVNSLKTMYPQFLNTLKLSNATDSELRKGDAIEINLGLDTGEAAKMLSTISLHTALKGSAKKIEPSSQPVNLLSPYEQAITMAHIERSSTKNVEELISKVKWEDIVFAHRKHEGNIRSHINRRHGTGATFVAEKAHELRLGKKDRNDVQFYSDDDHLIRTSDKNRRTPGAEAHISTGALAEMGREYLKNNKKHMDTDEGVKNRLKSLVKFFAEVNDENWNFAIDKLRGSGVMRWRKDISAAQFEDMPDGEKYFDTTPVKNSRGEDIHKSILSNQEVFDNASWSMMYLLGGANGRDPENNKEDSGNGVILNVVPEQFGNHERSGNKKSLFAMNATRFPNQAVGQNTMVFIKGITLGGQGVQVKDNWYTKIMGGDWDGDTLQIIGINKSAMHKAVVGERRPFGSSDQEMIDGIFDWHYKANLVRRLQSGATIAGDPKDKGVGQNVGEAIEALSNASHTSGYMGIHSTQINDIAGETFREMFTEDIKTAGVDVVKERFDRFYVKDEAIEDMQYHTDLAIADTIMLNPVKGKVKLYGTIKNVQAGDNFTIKDRSGNKRNYKVTQGFIRKNNMYKPVISLLNMDDKDFGFRNVMSFEGPEINRLKFKEMSQLATSRLSMLSNGLMNNFNKVPGTIENIELKMLEVMPMFEEGLRPIDFMANKRMLNTGILNDQMGNVGVNNVKLGGLQYMAKKLDNVNETVSDLSRKLVTASKFGIGDFFRSKDGRTTGPVLEAFGQSYADDAAAFQANQMYSNNASRFIDNITKSIDMGASGYLSLDEYKAFRAVKKRQTDVSAAYLKVAALTDKYNSSLFSDEMTMSQLHPDVADVAKIFNKLNAKLRTSIVPKLQERADDALRTEMDFDNLEKLFIATNEVEVEEKGKKRVVEMNMGEELVHLTAIERSLDNFATGIGKEGGVTMYKALLNTTASIGKDINRTSDLLEQLRQDVNRENVQYSDVTLKNVNLKSQNKVKALLDEMGLDIEVRKSNNGIAQMAKILATSGGNKGIIEDNIRLLEENALFSRENQYTHALVNRKTRDELTLGALYDIFTKETYDDKSKNYAEKLSLMKALISNVSEGGQAAMKLYDLGATGSFITSYERALNNGMSPKYTKEDVVGFGMQRRKAIKQKLRIFDTATTEAVKSQVEVDKLSCE